jgi:hypothetical protein
MAASILFRSALDTLSSDPQRSNEFISAIDVDKIMANYGGEMTDMGISKKDISDIKILIKSSDEPGITVEYQDTFWFGYGSGHAVGTKFTREIPLTVQCQEDGAARKFFLWWNQKTQNSEVLRIVDGSPNDVIGTGDEIVYPTTHISGLGTQKAGGEGIIRNDGLFYMNAYGWDAQTLGTRDSSDDDILARPLYRINFINATPGTIGTMQHSHEGNAQLMKFTVGMKVDSYYWIFRKNALNRTNQ